MGIIIYVGSYFGKWLDAHYETSNKVYTIVLTLGAVVISMINLLLQLKRINKKYD